METDATRVNAAGAFALELADSMRAAVEAVAGLGGEAPAALLTIAARGGCTIDHVARTIGLSHPGTSRLIDRLEADALLERARGKDGRAVSLRLTSEGRAVARQAQAARAAAIDEALGPLSPAKRDRLLGLIAEALSRGRRSRSEARHTCRLCAHRVCRGDACPVGASVPR